MSAPKCKLCGSPHWLREPHIWRDAPRAAAADVVSLPPSPPPPSEPRKQRVEAAKVEVAAIMAKPKFDRNAYQRDWMRRHRASLKKEK